MSKTSSHQCHHSFINVMSIDNWIQLTLIITVALSSFAYAASVKELTTAMDLDGQRGITLVSSSKIVFKVQKIYSDYYDYVL